VLAWEQIIVYKSNAGLLSSKQGKLDKSITYLSVILTIMVAIKVFFQADGIKHPAIGIIFGFPLLFLPIFISVLVGISNRLQYGLKSKVLTAASEIILSEVYRYRTGSGSYGEKAEVRIGEYLQKVVEMVTATVVGEMSLSRDSLERVRMSNFAVSPDDDGFSTLSPDLYIKFRLNVNCVKYSTNTVSLAKFLFQSRVLVFAFGAAGTILAALQLSIFVAVSTALAVAIQSQIEKTSPLTSLMAHNRCIGELHDARAWWKARTQIEQANPQKFGELVRITETSLRALLQAVNPAAASLNVDVQPQVDLDVNGLVADITTNMTDGRIGFSNAWMDKYGTFFNEYNKWYAEIENLRPCSSGPPTKPLMSEVRYQASIPKMTEERLSAHSTVEILWDPDEFLLRTSTAVMMAPPLMSTSVQEITDLLDLDNWMRKNSGLAAAAAGTSMIRGCVTIIGASNNLDEFLMKGEDDLGYKLPDRLSAEESIARLRMVFSRGIIAAAQRAGAVVLTSGLDVGPPSYAGIASRDRLYSVPVVGIVAKSSSSWPGDERPKQLERQPLQPDHTHFVMLPSEDEASSINFRFKLAHHYTNYGALPSIAFVVNGGVAALDGVLATVRMGWPVVVIKGSGGLADRIAEGKKDPGKFITDPLLTEILQEGNIEFLELCEVDGGLCLQMMDRIFSSNTNQAVVGGSTPEEDAAVEAEYAAARKVGAGAQLVSMGASGLKESAKAASGIGFAMKEKVKPLASFGANRWEGVPVDLDTQIPNAVAAWERQVLYKDNAQISKSIAVSMTRTLLILGVLSTTLAAVIEFVKKMDREGWDGVNSGQADISVFTLNYVLFLIPILVAMMISVENETRQGLKATLLTSGAEILLSHIYQYRAGVGDYAGAASAKNSAMQTRLREEDERVGSSGVNEMGLSQAGVVSARRRAFLISEHDDAFSPLTPEDYVTLRLEKMQRYYENSSLVCARRSGTLNVSVYALGGVGSALAIVNDAQVFVAVTTAVSSALVTLMEKEKYQEKIFVFNRCISDLTSVLTWWRSLSPIAKANPQKFTKLVQDVEAIKEREIKSLFPSAFKAAKEGDSGPVFNSILFSQDIIDSINSRGQVVFKRTWVERHETFFKEYQGWMTAQGMWEQNTEEAVRRPAIAEKIATEFLKSSVITTTPIRRGMELLSKWVEFWNDGERTAQEWWDMGPMDPPVVGSPDYHDGA